jgi:hypothetical protein
MSRTKGDNPRQVVRIGLDRAKSSFRSMAWMRTAKWSSARS